MLQPGDGSPFLRPRHDRERGDLAEALAALRWERYELLPVGEGGEIQQSDFWDLPASHQPSHGMFSESAALYDLIYRSFKDYEAEAAEIAETIKSHSPQARTVLDVACGTGEHARILSERHGYEVDGVDIEPEFIRLAQQKNPHGRFRQADMRAFDIGRAYDVVLCLFSSIGYAKTLDGVRETLANFAAHIREDGLIMVEPWYPPGSWHPGTLYLKTAETDDLKVCRMSHSDVEGKLSKITFEYLVGRPDGIRRMSEIHELGLFTVEQMKACFAQAGLSVDYDEDGPSGRGMYVARRAG